MIYKEKETDMRTWLVLLVALCVAVDGTLIYLVVRLLQSCR